MRSYAALAVILGAAAGLAATGILGTSCGEPTCETACARVFDTCGFDYEQPGTTTQDHLEGCVDACRQALDTPSLEEEAATWALCVSTYPCEGAPPDPHGFAIRAACPPDEYYLGDLTAQ